MNHGAEYKIAVVKVMLEAFGKGDMKAFGQTLSDYSTWTYHGANDIPYAGTYTGREEVLGFISNIMTRVDVLDFQAEQFIADGNTVVVLGKERQRIKQSQEILEQRWVQVYTVQYELITAMEEFAYTARAAQLFGK